MASFYGYVMLLVGLSLLLSMAGLQVGTANILNKYVTFSQPDGSFNLTSFNATGVDTQSSGDGQDSFSWLLTMFGVGAIVAGSVALATKDIGQGLKSGFASMVFALGVIQFVSLINYAILDQAFGGIVGIIASIIYIPLFITYFVAAINWIGGKD